MSDYIKGYTDALTGAGWLASVDPTALDDSGLGKDFEPLSIREHRRKYDAAVVEKFLREHHSPSFRVENPEDITPFLRERDAEKWDEGFTRGFYVGVLPEWGIGSDASEPIVVNPYETKEGTE